MKKTIAEQRAFDLEVRVLSKSILHSLINISVQKFTTYSNANLLPVNLTLDICTKNLSGIDELLKDSHKIISIEQDKDSINFSLSYEELSKTIKKANKALFHRELLITYLTKGASSYCMHDLFCISKSQCVSLRKQYNLKANSCGRQDLGELELAKELYDNLNSTPENLKQDILDISVKHNISLNTVWHAIRSQPQKCKEKGNLQYA